MKVHIYEHLMAMQASRRNVLKGAASVGAIAAAGSSGILGTMSRAFAADMSADEIALRKAIVQIPGVGKGSPTDADWQKVGEMCLGATKANVKEGEFKGVELTFMGLNNQNLHDFLFRGFLKPWEAYTGAKITWIDLAQADYNPRLQQAIATGTVDFDIVEMGAPFEGDVGSKGLMSEMPDWVKTQIDFDDLVNYLKPPVGTWEGKQMRVTVDGDTHNFNYRTDYFADEGLAKAWTDEGHEGKWEVPRTWQKVQEVTKFLKGKKINGQDAYGYLDAPKPWGGFGFYFLESRATAYAKYPGEPAWLFDVDTMKPRVNNPAFVRAIQDVIDALPSEPPNQINADPNETAFSQFLGGTGSMLAWWGDVGSNAKTSELVSHRRHCRLRHPARLGRRLQRQDGQMGDAFKRPELCTELRLSRLGSLRHQAGRRRCHEAQGGVERGGASRRQGPVTVDGDVSVGLPALPEQPLHHQRVGRRRL